MAERVVIGSAELWHGDCREVLPLLPRPGLLLTDPPYGVAHETGWSSPWQGQIANDATVGCRDEALAMCVDVPAYVFGSRKRPEPKGTRMVLVWDKGPALGMGALDLPWKPTYEEIYVVGRGFQGRRDGAVIYCPPVQSMAKNGREHPNEKPVKLLRMLLDKAPPGRVCDAFMGSGSTGVACVESSRDFVGIEIERRYFDIACERIARAQAQGRMFPPELAAVAVQQGLEL